MREKQRFMNILYGLYQQEGGRDLHKRGETGYNVPYKSNFPGYGITHQHFMLATPLSVVENVMLGRKSRRGIWLDTKRKQLRN